MMPSEAGGKWTEEGQQYPQLVDALAGVGRFVWLRGAPYLDKWHEQKTKTRKGEERREKAVVEEELTIAMGSSLSLDAVSPAFSDDCRISGTCRCSTAGEGAGEAPDDIVSGARESDRESAATG